MNVQQFEQEILKLAFETNARITAASVAYYLGIPSREANRMLNELLHQGVLELDSDVDGNLYFRVPTPSGEADIFDFAQGLDEDLSEPSVIVDDSLELEEAIIEASKPVVVPPERSPVEDIRLVSASEDSGAEPFSPSRNRPPEINAQRAADGSSAHPPAEKISHAPSPESESRNWHAHAPRHEAWSRPDDDHDRGSAGYAVAEQPRAHSYADQFDAVQRTESSSPVRSRGVYGGVTARSMEPDAWVGNCGASSVVVRADTRCEPKPLSEARPMIISCVDADEEHAHHAQAQQTQMQASEQWWNSQVDSQGQSGAMVLAGNQNLPATLDDIEQPEHQPGMALLLSLILCGTGQIYNGEVSKGIMMMVLCFLLWFVLLGWVVHIWSIVDAVVVAERINRRQHA